MGYIPALHLNFKQLFLERCDVTQSQPLENRLYFTVHFCTVLYLDEYCWMQYFKFKDICVHNEWKQQEKSHMLLRATGLQLPRETLPSAPHSSALFCFHTLSLILLPA